MYTRIIFIARPDDSHSLIHDGPGTTNSAPANAGHSGTSCSPLVARDESGISGRPPGSGARAPDRSTLTRTDAVPQRVAIPVGMAQRRTLIGSRTTLVRARSAICYRIQRPAGQRPGPGRRVARLAPQLLTRRGRCTILRELRMD